MCGIAGILHRDGRPASITALTAMTDIIAHRGPDGEGHYCNGPVGLGHRPLAVVAINGDGGLTTSLLFLNCGDVTGPGAVEVAGFTTGG